MSIARALSLAMLTLTIVTQYHSMFVVALVGGSEDAQNLRRLWAAESVVGALDATLPMLGASMSFGAFFSTLCVLLRRVPSCLHVLCILRRPSVCHSHVFPGVIVHIPLFSSIGYYFLAGVFVGDSVWALGVLSSNGGPSHLSASYFVSTDKDVLLISTPCVRLDELAQVGGLALSDSVFVDTQPVHPAACGGILMEITMFNPIRHPRRCDRVSSASCERDGSACFACVFSGMCPRSPGHLM